MQYSNEDMDSLHILPLTKVPLQTRGLQSVKLIKNSKLHSVVELFSGEQTGSGQIEIDDIGSRFDALKDPSHPDLMLLKKIGKLQSYDVLSLRITLREQGIPLGQQEALRLSSTMQTARADFTRRFTQSLLKQTFAPTPLSEDGEIEFVPVDDDDTGRDLSKLINPSDPDIVRANLADLAKRLEIRLDALPGLLEEVADLHLSTSYYEDCYDEVVREYDEFLALVTRVIRSNKIFQHDSALLQNCARIEYDVTSSKRFVQEHLAVFENLEREFWNDISASRFREIEDVAKANQLRLGGILCGMTFRMNSWRKKFRSPELVTPFRLAEFVRSELRDGIRIIQNAA